MALVRVNPNLEAELTGALASHGPMERNLADLADLIALRAQAIARAEFYDTGAYARSIRSEHGLDETGHLVGRVVATDWKSHFAEWPPRQQRATKRGHILQRAAEQVGLVVVAAGAAGAAAGGMRGIGGGGRRAIGGRSPLAITGR